MTNTCAESWRCLVGDCERKSTLPPPENAPVRFYSYASFSSVARESLTVGEDEITTMRLNGALTKATSTELEQRFEWALSERAVKGILFALDSTGGDPNPRAPVLFSLLASRKPTVLCLGRFCCSAGLQFLNADAFVIANAATQLGSMGVITGYCVDGKAVALGSAPLKVKMASAVAPIICRINQEEILGKQSEVDAQGKAFTAQVARLRGIAVDRISALGDCRLISAPEALSRGLVDCIANRMSYPRRKLRRMIRQRH